MPFQPRAGGESLPDVQTFLDLLSAFQRSAEMRQFFDPDVPLTVARAPGRLDLMGGIADYSGSLVLQLPIREAAFVAVQPDDVQGVRIISIRQPPTASWVSLAELRTAGGEPISYDSLRAGLTDDKRWTGYVIGVFLVLMREKGVGFSQGARILICSDVPEGKGVSSSAALEVAVMQAVAGAFGVPLDPRELALLCQLVENRVVGAPCGIMDQMTSVMGEENRLLSLLCQPAEVQGMIPLPEELAVWGIDSGVRHSVSGADYGSVRVGAFMGYRILAELAGLPVCSVGDGPERQQIRVEDHRWNGYLANLTPSEFEQRVAARLPERLLGAEFLERYGGTTDAVTRVDPQRTYSVRVPTAHPIYENFRVRTFAELLAMPNARAFELLGELMFQSHASYSACGLGAGATDRLVELVRRIGPSGGLFGAKITGGGSGGTVAVLGRRDAEDALETVVAQFERETGPRPYVFRGSSPGAAAFGTLTPGF